MATAHPRASFDIIFSPIAGSPSPFDHLLKVFFHES
jgi:hypothetical protein